MTQPNSNHLQQTMIRQFDILAATAMSTCAGIARAAYASWNGYSVKELDFSKIIELLDKTMQKSLQKGSLLVGMTTFISCLSDKAGKFVVGVAAANGQYARHIREIGGVCASILSIVGTTNILQRAKVLNQEQALTHMTLAGVSYLFYKCLSLYNQAAITKEFQILLREEPTQVEKIEREISALERSLHENMNKVEENLKRESILNMELSKYSDSISTIGIGEKLQDQIKALKEERNVLVKGQEELVDKIHQKEKEFSKEKMSERLLLSQKTRYREMRESLKKIQEQTDLIVRLEQEKKNLQFQINKLSEPVPTVPAARIQFIGKQLEPITREINTIQQQEITLKEELIALDVLISKENQNPMEEGLVKAKIQQIQNLLKNLDVRKQALTVEKAKLETQQQELQKQVGEKKRLEKEQDGQNDQENS